MTLGSANLENRPLEKSPSTNKSVLDAPKNSFSNHFSHSFEELKILFNLKEYPQFYENFQKNYLKEKKKSDSSDRFIVSIYRPLKKLHKTVRYKKTPFDFQNFITIENSEPQIKLTNILFFLQRLSFEEKFIVLFHDRYQFSFQDIAYGMSHPEGSVHTIYDLALKSLAHWVFDEPLNNQNKLALNKSLKEFQVTSVEKNIKTNFSKKSLWNKTPWYLKRTFEVSAIGLIFAGAFIFLPKLHNMYETSINEQYSFYKVDNIQPKKFASINTTPDVDNSVTQREITSILQTESNQKITVGNYEMWRFIIKTNAADEIKKEVEQSLKNIDHEAYQEIKAYRVPGGIQFNLTIPKESVLSIKDKMESLSIGEHHPKDTEELKKFFSWYKKRSVQKMPLGYTQIVIWISQI